MSDLPESAREGAICPECNGDGRIDFNEGWRGPPNVERHHWHPCPTCNGSGRVAPVSPAVEEPERTHAEIDMDIALGVLGEFVMGNDQAEEMLSRVEAGIADVRQRLAALAGSPSGKETPE